MSENAARRPAALLSAAAALVLAATAATAQPVHYTCKIHNPPTGSAMAAGVDIFFNPEKHEAYAIDSAIYQRYRKAVKVKVEVDNARRTTFTWTVRDLPGTLNSRHTILPGVIESATIQKGSLALSFYSRPLAYDGSYGMNGQCSAKPFRWPKN